MTIQRISRQEADAFMARWHYLGNCPAAATQCFGNGSSVAAYGTVHAPKMPKDYLELRRLASNGEDVLSRFLAETLRALKKDGVPAVLTWADPAAGHHGGIYQATNWLYTEPRSYSWNSHYLTPSGEVVDHRKAFNMFGSSARRVVLARNPDWVAFLPPMKFRYLMPLCVSAEEALAATRSLRRPYPKPAQKRRPMRLPAKQRKATA